MRRKRERQFEIEKKRRANLAKIELARLGGYLDRVERLASLQYLVASVIEVIGEEINDMLKEVDLDTVKTISIQNTVRKASESYFKLFSGAIDPDMTTRWASDLDELEKLLYGFMGIDKFEPNIDLMRSEQFRIEKEFGVEIKLNKIDK